MYCHSGTETITRQPNPARDVTGTVGRDVPGTTTGTCLGPQVPRAASPLRSPGGGRDTAAERNAWQHQMTLLVAKLAVTARECYNRECYNYYECYSVVANAIECYM